MSESPAAIFIPDGERFIPTELAASPWGAQVLHGGPPAGLLARAIERAHADPEMHVSRITVDLFRPVPREPLHTTTRIVREGRRIAVVEASLFAGETEVSRATALLLRQSTVDLPGEHLPPAATLHRPEGIPTTGLSEMLAGDATTGSPRPRMDGVRGFHTTIEVRRVDARPGGGTAWIRIPVPFVLGEETSPLVRVAATADFGNALGHIRAGASIGFINADISLYLHRMPVGEWIALQTHGSAQPHGVGLVESIVHDVSGPIGRVDQALLANPRNPAMMALDGDAAAAAGT
jgi:hypothetical protein